VLGRPWGIEGQCLVNALAAAGAGEGVDRPDPHHHCVGSSPRIQEGEETSETTAATRKGEKGGWGAIDWDRTEEE
jgi:hypothetical protein